MSHRFPNGAGLYKQSNRYAHMLARSDEIRKRKGGDRAKRHMRHKEEPVSTDIVPGKRYTPGQLDAIASELLRQDARSELCRDCGERGLTTGSVEHTEQQPVDAEGTMLILDFTEYECGNGHRWYQGEGAVRGIGGDNPILFEEHFQSRRRREIYTTLGTPDPSIVQGMYNKTHPQGRKVNSEEQRRRNGASFFR